MHRLLLHADLDAFFASVEQLDDPSLRGRPVVVGGAVESRGVVAAASYEARAYGIHSAQPMRTAMLRCPDLIRVSPRFGRYREISDQVMTIFSRWTPLVEPLSLDEAYLDLSGHLTETTPDVVREAAARIKAEVREATGLTVSVGAGTTKSVAKVASDLKKPDGLVVIPAGAERIFLAPLPAGKLWGVGPKAQERLQRIGVRTIGDLATLDRRWLEDRFGRWGLMLHDLAHGIDPRPVTPERETKSVSVETTFAEDIWQPAQVDECLIDLAGHVCHRLRRQDLQGRTVTLKLRDAGFTTHTRQRTLAAATDDEAVVLDTARRLLAPELTPGRRLRLLGIGLSGFADAVQLALPLDLTAG
ncbi:MAG: DNA polymerase IV [Dehalococcoidia bacterium]